MSVEGGMPREEVRWAAPRPGPGRRLPAGVNLLFLMASLYTTLLAGVLMALDDYTPATMWDVMRTPSLWDLGLSYALPVLLILGAHEMGHYVACRLYRIDATLPFFIPGPPLFGTFGAVIRIRAPFTDRRALFDIGVAGPIAGFVVAIPVLLYGLGHSTIVAAAPPAQHGFILPSCLLLDLLYRWYFPGATGSIQMHPAFAAAWLGLFATFLNLLPVGQLDGGHILYALSSRIHRSAARFVLPLMVVTGLLLGGIHLIVFAILILMLGTRHPPMIYERRDLGRGRIAVAILAFVIFILCLIPGGFQVS
ncbi:MAG TPA: site-2 protease family protein [Candidatus Polarisedimenticolia bacterium]|nr:site-2 protease family protein [Candidatus Polarisedimenticolia bacterium]